MSTVPTLTVSYVLLLNILFHVAVFPSVTNSSRALCLHRGCTDKIYNVLNFLQYTGQKLHLLLTLCVRRNWLLSPLLENQTVGSRHAFEMCWKYTILES